VRNGREIRGWYTGLVQGTTRQRTHPKHAAFLRLDDLEIESTLEGWHWSQEDQALVRNDFKFMLQRPAGEIAGWCDRHRSSLTIRPHRIDRSCVAIRG
jgi:hypothetical protein